MRSGWQKRGEIWSLQWPLYPQINWISGVTVHVYLLHLQATVAQHCSLLLHPGSLLGTWCIYIVWIQHISPFRWTMKGQVAMEKKIRKRDPADINYTYWTKQHAGFFLFLCIENCRIFTTSHLIRHSDRGPWLDQSSKTFASNNGEKSNIFYKCFHILKEVGCCTPMTWCHDLSPADSKAPGGRSLTPPCPLQWDDEEK